MTEELIDRFAGHTPGPWNSRYHGEIDGTFMYFIHEKGLSVCANNKADIALIAAAPDLLAENLALSARVAELEGERQRISQWCDERFNCGSTEALDHISAILRASLTKEAVVDGR